MRYIFFFSYSRTNHDEYLMRFYKDLQRRVELELALPPDQRAETEYGFLDEQDLELGSDWDPKLVEALQNSSVLVCAYSPSYFVSEYCSREWHLFQMRRREWPDSKLNMAPLPPAIKPVIWLSPTRRMTRDAVHTDVWDVQFTLGQSNAIYNTDGVELMLRMSNKYADDYQDFLRKLALDIIDAAEKYATLPRLGSPVPRLSDIAPLFPLKKKAPIPQPPGDAVFPQHRTSLVFAALALGADAEAPAWRPFGADGHCIEFIIQGIAIRDLNTACRIEHIATIADLLHLAERAAAHHQALVMLADPASAALLAQQPLGLKGFPLLVLGAPGEGDVATLDELRALLVERIPRLLSKAHNDVQVSLPSSIVKPIISASNGKGQA